MGEMEGVPCFCIAREEVWRCAARADRAGAVVVPGREPGRRHRVRRQDVDCADCVSYSFRREATADIVSQLHCNCHIRHPRQQDDQYRHRLRYPQQIRSVHGWF
jgi:hypothetical protein